jgi:hypothetical protein
MHLKMTKQRKQKYCEALARGLRRGKAAESVGVDRHTINRAQQKDPDFAKACIESEAAACDIIENVMWEKILEKGDNTLILAWLYNRGEKDRWMDKRFYREPDVAKEQTVDELKAELKKRGFESD